MKGPLVSLELAQLNSPGSPAVGKTMLWKLNQELLGTVISRSAKGKLQIQIGGKTYSFQSSTKVQPGQSLTLKVVSLTPQLQLEFVDTLRNRAKLKTSPATILSAQLLQKALHMETKNISNLLNFINSFSLSGLRSLPVETASLLNTLKKKLSSPKDLSDPARLKSALKNSGILLESKLGSQPPGARRLAADTEGDLKAILLQIFQSLDKNPPGTRDKPRIGNPNTHALIAYKNNMEKSGMRDTQLKQKVEQALSKITLKQNNTLDEMSKGNQRWFFDLLVNFPSRPVSIPITIYRDGHKSNDFYTASRWGAEFSIELENGGFISAQVNIVESSVTVSLRSELRETAQFLNKHCDILRDKLNNCGLTLSAFHCEQLNTGQC